MAKVKVYKYEFFDSKTGDYVPAEGYTTQERLVTHNFEAVRAGRRPWRLIAEGLLQVDEKKTADGFYREER